MKPVYIKNCDKKGRPDNAKTINNERGIEGLDLPTNCSNRIAIQYGGLDTVIDDPKPKLDFGFGFSNIFLYWIWIGLTIKNWIEQKPDNNT